MEKLAQRHAAQVLDVLGARLGFERTAVRLYDRVIERMERHAEPRYHPIIAQLRQIRDEEKEHEEWIEAQIRALGGSPEIATEMAELEREEESGIEHIIDSDDKPIHLVHALLAFELADNAGWDVLVKLADDVGDRTAKLQFARRLGEEAKHLLFMREVVIRAAEIELLGRDVALPTSARAVAAMRAPLIGAALLGVGAISAASFWLARRA
jgi:hypothetical protein